MSEYKLYCFAQSGNAYRAALMLNLIGAKWEPIWVDFFKGGETRTPKYRETVNEMGEVPVLVDGNKKFSQSAVIINHLAKKSGKFLPQSGDDWLEALRWMIFDNQKINGFLGPYRFLRNWAKGADPAVGAFFKGRLDGNLAIVNKRTIADISMCAYMYYPAEEFGFDLAKDHPAIGAWLERIKLLPNWVHPYELMPGHPMAA
jgi:glutathione S-transferase